MGIVQRQSFINTIISYLGVVIGYVNVAYLFPRFFTPEEVGLRSVLFEFSLILAQLSALGFSSVTNKYFPYFTSKIKKEKGFLSFLLLIPTISFLIISIILFLFKNTLFLVASTKTLLLTEYYYLIFFGAYFIAQSFIVEAYTTFFNPLVGIFFRNVFARLLTTLFIFLYVMDFISIDIFWYLLVSTFATTYFGLIIYLIIIRQLQINLNFSFLTPTILKQIFSFGFFGLLTSMGSVILLKIDIVMIVYLLKDLASLGVYSIAIYIASVIEIPKRSLVQVTIPILTKAYKEDNHIQIQELYQKTALNQLIIGVFIFLAIITNLDSIFNIIPNGTFYKTGEFAIIFLGLAKVIDLGTGINGEIIGYSKYYKYNFIFLLLLAVIGIALNFWLIPILGITGAALATILAYFCFNLLKYFFLFSKMRLQPFTKSFLYVLFLGLLAYGVLQSLNFHLPDLILIAIKMIGLFFLFLLPILALKISPDLNMVVARFFKIKF